MSQKLVFMAGVPFLKCYIKWCSFSTNLDAPKLIIQAPKMQEVENQLEIQKGNRNPIITSGKGERNCGLTYVPT